ncbi:hypothetical protein BGX26_002501 [Mortierella sp. AD094]|nr:hypothetical protein BGX26_002501 [Mortierella sp. AD094]
MAKFNALALLVFAMFLNVAMAWSCYCASSCSSSGCSSSDTATYRACHEDFNWRYAENGGIIHCYNLMTEDDKSAFFSFCKKYGAIGGSCY